MIAQIIPLAKPPTSLRTAQSQADLLLTLTTAAEKVEGWAPSQGNTLINVAVLAQCSTPQQASVRSVVDVSDPVDVVPVPDKSILFPGQDIPEEGG